MSDSYPVVVTPVAHKGGVGKTLTLRLLYQAIARVLTMNNEPRKLLVVDMDPQCNSSSRWLEMEHETQGKIRGRMPPVHPDLDGERSDISDIWLLGQAPEPYPTANPRIDIIPARTLNLNALIGSQSEHFHIEGLRRWLEQANIADDYCAVFIDTPPTTGMLTQTALTAATACYTPVEYEPHPIDGMDQMLHLVDSEKMSRSADHPLAFLGIVPNKAPSNANAAIYRAFKDALASHPTYRKHMIGCELRDLAAFVETDAKSTLPGDIFDYPSRSHSNVLRLTETYCKSVLTQIPEFSKWNLDFRKGESFEPGDAVEGA